MKVCVCKMEAFAWFVSCYVPCVMTFLARSQYLDFHKPAWEQVQCITPGGSPWLCTADDVVPLIEDPLPQFFLVVSVIVVFFFHPAGPSWSVLVACQLGGSLQRREASQCRFRSMEHLQFGCTHVAC